MGRIYNKKYGYSESVVMTDEAGNTLGDTNTPMIVQGAAGATPVIVQNIGTSLTNKTIIDTFGRQRISEPKLLFDGNFQQAPELIDPTWIVRPQLLPAAGVVLHNPLQGSVMLSVVGAGDIAEVSSHRYLSESAGSSRIMYMAGVLAHLSPTAISRFGIFDINDGAFFQFNAVTGVAVTLRSSITGLPVDVTIPRIAWTDKFDGTGASKLNIDFNLAQTFVIDFAPTGAGLVRFGILSGGEFHACLTLDGSNVAPTPAMRSTTLPVTFQLEGAGLPIVGVIVPPTTCQAFSATVIIEGEVGAYLDGVSQFSAVNALGVAAVPAIPTPIVSVKMKPIFPLIGGFTNRASAKLVNVNIYDGGASYIWSVWRNATLTAPLWVDAGAKSACMYDTSSLGLLPLTGTLVASGLGGKRTALPQVMLDAVQSISNNRFTGLSETFTLCVEDDPVKGGATPQGTLTWKEEY